MACAMMLGAFGTMFGADGHGQQHSAAANATAAVPNDLARLQALIKELEPSVPVPQPTMPELTSMPMVEEAPRGEAKFPNAEAEGNVMVFDEAEASVERALRRLAPSPGAQAVSTSYNVPVPMKSGKWCTMCHEFFNGATDSPSANMCTKTPKSGDGGSKQATKTACYANHAGCPSDMTPYTCDVDSSAVASGTDSKQCHAARVASYNALKAENAALMIELLALKQAEQDLTLELITKAELHPTCSCTPVNQLKTFLGA